MIAVLKFVLIVGALAYAGVVLFLLVMQSRLVFHPYRPLEASPADVGLEYENLHLRSGEETIHAWFIPAAGPDTTMDKGARGTVLFCHGNAGNISHRLPTISILHGLGMNTLLFDYRGYGESTGSPSERGSYADVAACWDWLVLEHGESPERIVIMGRSLGGAVAARAAETTLAAGAGPAGLVLESTFTSVPDMGARMYPFLPVRLLARISYDTRARLKNIACPVLVAHSPDDDIVPYALGRQLLEAAGRGATFLDLEGDHNNGYQLTGERYAQGLDRFFSMAVGDKR